MNSSNKIHQNHSKKRRKNEIIKTDNLKYTNKQVPVSFSIFSNIEGYNIKPIHVVNKDPKELIKIFVKTLVQVAKQAYKINTKIYKDIYKQIDELFSIFNNYKKFYLL